ncbi:MAG: hypothetical protein HOV79_19950 [Hamadaea sp.]|nr:hypothetical protein [Hamadaea sp.]
MKSSFLRALRNNAVIAAASAVILAGTAAVALADEWGTGTSNTGAHPDSDPHTYCYSSSVGSDARPNIEAAEWDALDPTAVNVDYNSSCDLSSSTETDVVWRQANLAAGVSGSTYCEDFDTYCDQFYVTLDMAQIAVGSEDEIDETQTACHELGHSAGLTHGGSTDCMINSPDTPPTALQFRRYNDHHKSHLTAWFN